MVINKIFPVRYLHILQLLLLQPNCTLLMKKLLIVDDSTELLAMQRLLSFYNFSVRGVKDSKSLMTELKTFKPDIVLLDIFLGEEDGRKICRQLREDPDNINVAVILFSGSEKHTQNYREWGADGAIQKPFAINDLVNQLKAGILNRKKVLAGN